MDTALLFLDQLEPLGFFRQLALLVGLALEGLHPLVLGLGRSLLIVPLQVQI